MFRGRERLVELGHIGVGVIADVAKPVVPDLLRLADEVVFIVLAEQAVGARMLLRSIYNALDLNSHFKLFQLVSRRGFGLAGDLDNRADRPQAVHRDEIPLPAVVLPRDVGLLPGVRVGVRTSLYTLNENRTALIQRGLAGLGGGVALDLDNRGNFTDQLPLAVLPLPFELDALVWLRIGVGFVAILIELLNVFRSVQCDGIVVCSIHLKQAVYVCAGQDAIVLRLMRGRILDALHTDLDLRVCNVRLRAAGIVRHGRVVLLPDGVDSLGAVFMFNVNRVARLILRSGRSRTVSPALEGVAFLARGLIGDGKGNPVHRWMRCRTRLTSRRTGAAIRIITQFKEWHPDGVDGLGRIVLGQYDRISARVLRSHSIRLVRPSNVIIARAGQLRSINIKREGSRRRGPIRHIREPCAVRAVVILIIQRVGILGSVAVNRKGRYRQHTEHHNQN